MISRPGCAELRGICRDTRISFQKSLQKILLVSSDLITIDCLDFLNTTSSERRLPSNAPQPNLLKLHKSFFYAEFEREE